MALLGKLTDYGNKKEKEKLWFIQCCASKRGVLGQSMVCFSYKKVICGAYDDCGHFNWYIENHVCGKEC